jgi:molecular chaperone HtpG
MTAAAEKHVFQAEVNEVLALVVNSLYSHREVFLREADQQLERRDRSAELPAPDRDQPARRRHGAAHRADRRQGRGTLTIRDNGIGMTHDELIGNLGTIARSGSKKLMQSLSAEQKRDITLIGQFGVGFYSAFLVADRVTVTSRKAGAEESWTWESEAKGDFEVRQAARPGRGTDVVLHLKADAKEYLDEWPLQLCGQQVQRLRALADPHGGRARREDEKKREWETLNAAQRAVDAQQGEHHARTVRRVLQAHEPRLERPARLDALQGRGHARTDRPAVRAREGAARPGRAQGPRRPLFVKRVFIMDDAQEILPEWLRFVRGVVDSEDLPLNVSREVLQKDATTAFIRKQIVGKTLTLLEELAAEGETEQHGRRRR